MEKQAITTTKQQQIPTITTKQQKHGKTVYNNSKTPTVATTNTRQ
jgi:hypothetical protein